MRATAQTDRCNDWSFEATSASSINIFAISPSLQLLTRTWCNLKRTDPVRQQSQRLREEIRAELRTMAVSSAYHRRVSESTDCKVLVTCIRLCNTQGTQDQCTGRCRLGLVHRCWLRCCCAFRCRLSVYPAAKTVTEGVRVRQHCPRSLQAPIE